VPARPASLAERQARARQTLFALPQREAALASDAAATARQLAGTRRSLTVAERRLGERLSALYEAGDAHPLEVVLGASSFGDALTELENLERTASQDREWITRAQELRRHLLELSRSLDRQRLAIQRLRLSAAATAAALAADQPGVESTLRAPARHASAPTPVAAPLPTLAVPGSITVVASAYSLPGTTATGAPVGFGTVAVDPAVIPLGARLSIPGYGPGVASDTGSAVHGAHVDVWFPTIEEALAWGTRTVTVTIHRG
jgi:3D (Asp-Asp-Asp) domain-containing protein